MQLRCMLSIMSLDITARVERDSCDQSDAPHSRHLGERITTMVLKYPRYIHSEVMTHRQFSRNAASSRAIPTRKLLDQVLDTPVVPIEWGSNQSGMQAGDEISEMLHDDAERHWLDARDAAHTAAAGLAELGVHKQYVNRLLEPFLYIEVVVTATDWSNFFRQRISPLAQPEIKALAVAMKEAYDASEPEDVSTHRPFIRTEEASLADPVLDAVSVARSARVSYLNHDTGDVDVSKDLELFQRLLLAEPMHASPFEHLATKGLSRSRYANYTGWMSARWLLENNGLDRTAWLSMLKDHES